MAHVFVSYASQDRELVRPLVAELEARGHSIWWDRRIDLGTTFDEAIEAALDEADWVMPIWTANSVGSRWVRAESMSAMDHDALLPVLLEDVTPPVAFRMVQAADLRDWTPGESNSGLDQLLARLEGAPIVASSIQPRSRRLAKWRVGWAGWVGFAVVVLGLALLASLQVIDREPEAFVGPDYAGIPSVAVLPFHHGDDPEDRLFADGLTDEIIQGLQQYRSFPVVSRHASFALRDSQLSIADVGRRLGTQYIVTGSVRRAGDSVRVSAVLTNSFGEQVWSDTFDSQLQSEAVFAMQDTIAERILGVMHPQLVVGELDRIDDRDPSSLEAWALVLRALDIVYNLDTKRIAEAERYLEQALALDAGLPMAYWARAELAVYSYLEDGLLGAAAKEREGLIIADFEEALEISPFDGSVCGCLAFVHMMRRDEPAARAVIESALPVNPSNAVLRMNYGMYLLHVGNLNEAKSEVEIALRLDPISRFGTMAWATLGQIAALEGDLDAAITHTRRGLQLEARETFSQIQLPTLLLLNDQKARAEDAFADLIKDHSGLHPRNKFTYGWMRPLEKLMRARNVSAAEASTEALTAADLLEIDWRELGWSG